MQIIKWNPIKEIDRLFGDRLLQPFAAFPDLGLDLAVDMYEEKGSIVANMSLPGIKPEEINVSLDEDSLTISGKREEEKETDKKNYYSKEIRRGSFSRTVSLPKSVDASKAEAKYGNGVLSVTMPVMSGAKAKSVKVEVMK